MVFRSVVVTENGGNAYRVTHKRGGKNHADIHHNAVCRNTVFTRVAQKANIVKHSDKAHRDVAHKLGRTVGACLKNRLKVEFCLSETQNTRVLSAEINERNNSPDKLAGGCGDCRTCELIFFRQRYNENGIENHIRNARHNSHEKPELWPFRRHEKRLKKEL